MRAVLEDDEARSYIDGVAWHCYAGSPDVMSEVKALFPDVGVYFTECSGGEWDTDFAGNLMWNMEKLIIGGTRHYAQTVLLWNLALDPDFGPTHGGCMDCRGVVTIDTLTGEYRRNVEYYVLGHASKFVKPGAVRIESSSFSGRLESVAFQNPDETVALIVSNPWPREQTFDVVWNDQVFSYVLEGRSVVTFIW